MNLFKGSAAFAFLVGIGVSTIFGVKHMGNAQEKGSEPIISQMPPTTKIPIGNRRGLDELTAVFEASEVTKAIPIRQVFIKIPAEMSDIRRRRVAALTTIREFFLIADKESFKYDGDTPRSAPDLTSPQGVEAILPNGGTIVLKLRKENNGKEQRTVGEIRLKDHRVPGYEEVTQIEFIGE